MHLNSEVFDNIDAFMKHVEYVENKTDEREFEKSSYVPDYSFYSGTITDAPGYNYISIAEYIEELAAKCIRSYQFFNRVFKYKRAALKPYEIYELGYWCYLHYKLETVDKPLASTIADILKGISFARIPRDEFDDNTQFLSEWAIADILFSIDSRRACGIISKLDIPSKHIAELKKFIIRGDNDGFIHYLIEYEINTSMLQVACAILTLAGRIELESHPEDVEPDVWNKMISDVLEDPDIELGPAYFRFLHSLLYNPSVLSFENIVGYTYTSQVLIVQMVQHLKHYSTNIVAVSEFEKILKKHPEFDNNRISYDDFAKGLILNPRFKIFEDFKERFVFETPYPPSVGREKPKKSCYRYNEDNCRWKEDSILYLYHRLVNYGFLAWDEEVLFSFMYRMCRDYKPDRENPSPIVWNGKKTSLWSVVSHFHAETSKIDDLTRSFFLDKDGSPLGKKDGGKGSTDSKDPRIIELLQDPMFKKP